MIEALASYHARIGEWNTALELWEHAPLDQPFNREALTGIVKIHAARALVHARQGLLIVNQLKQSPSTDLEIQLPGNEAGMLVDTEKALRKLERALEKVAPATVQKALGLERTQ